MASCAPRCGSGARPGWPPTRPSPRPENCARRSRRSRSRSPVAFRRALGDDRAAVTPEVGAGAETQAAVPAPLLARSAPVLDGAAPELLARLADRAHRVRLPAGSALFEAGDPSDALYLVEAGSLEVVDAAEP